MKKIFIILFVIYFIKGYSQSNSLFHFNSSDRDLVQSVDWAKNKALSFSHDERDPVGFWYEAALPNREAFCVRDVSHQSIGAEILGLRSHNLNMVLKFTENISKSRNYTTYWEINRYNKPAPVDYNNDKDFWYNLPANFDMIYAIKRLHNWTGNDQYINNPVIQNFISLSLNEYVKEWQIDYNHALTRNRYMYVQPMNEFHENRFGNSRGIPTYYERGNILSYLGIDLTASYIAAIKSQIEILKLQNSDKSNIDKYIKKLHKELNFLNTFWWDDAQNAYKSIIYQDKTHEFYSIGEDEAFHHYLLYFDVLEENKRIFDIINWYQENQHKLIIELKSYLPVLFYQYGNSELANELLKELCSIKNARRNYPEISFTVIEHITRGLMGIDVNQNRIETISRLAQNQKWASVDGIPVIGSVIGVKHKGKNKTIFENLGDKKIVWKVKFEGNYNMIEVNNIKISTFKENEYGKHISYAIVSVEPNEKITAIALK